MGNKIINKVQGETVAMVVKSPCTLRMILMNKLN